MLVCGFFQLVSLWSDKLQSARGVCLNSPVLCGCAVANDNVFTWFSALSHFNPPKEFAFNSTVVLYHTIYH